MPTLSEQVKDLEEQLVSQQKVCYEQVYVALTTALASVSRRIEEARMACSYAAAAYLGHVSQDLSELRESYRKIGDDLCQ